MAAQQSFRSPLGVVVRTLPEWNARNMASAVVSISAVAAPFHTSDAGLWNNSTDGSSLVLWHLSIATVPDSSGPIFPPVAYGYFKASFDKPSSGPGSPIVVGAPVPAGLVWLLQDFGSDGNEQYSFPISNNVYEWPKEWPLAVIAPNQSFAVYVTSPWKDVEYTFLWEAVLKP